ncbi:MAG: Argininosuccinate synthase [Methanonatronarchaeales archaeon]|nr:Argininosuccinate synthase [Methanonatronarchaeales archaeon]
MKAVLAFSGGLDTSICVPLLRDDEEYGYDEVVTVAVDVGQSGEELEKARNKAADIGVEHHEVDAVEEFAERFLAPLVRANGSYEGYVLGTAVSRPIIAEKVVQVARETGASALVHGCTGRGNDQFRFENVFRGLMPDAEVIAPIREYSLTREEEIEMAEHYGVHVDATREEPWSIDENLWSRSIEGGLLEDPGNEPPESIFEWTASPGDAPEEPETVEITFEEGVPVALNGDERSLVDIIRELNYVAGEHGVGRTDIVEDRILGFKARENYEHPAATVLLEAHCDLERLTLTRRQLKHKSTAEAEWAELAYQGLVHEPLYEDLNALIGSTQKAVNGTVTLKLHRGTATVTSRESPDSLHRDDLASFESDEDQSGAEGAVRFHGFQG